MSASNIASVPVEMAGFFVTKNAEAAFDTNYAKPLKEWLECQDFILAAKAHQMGMLPVNAATLRHFPIVAQHAVSIPHLENELIFNEIQPALIGIFAAGAAIEDAAVKVSEKIKPVLKQLQDTSIRNKRDVLRYAQIIPTAIAAAYVGVSEHALKEWASLYQVFGSRYAGARSYSLAELNIIAENRFWICSEILACAPRSTTPDDDKVQDEVTMVDYDIAAAFTNLSYSEVVKQLPPNQLYNRPFRLSDLEKIRVAKLNAQPH
jgi:hypothetical protein